MYMIKNICTSISVKKYIWSDLVELFVKLHTSFKLIHIECPPQNPTCHREREVITMRFFFLWQKKT